MILVTGCTGFVGTYLIGQLAGSGYHVKCLARGTRGLEYLLDKEVTFTIGDVTQRDSLSSAMEGVDTVIHLVGIIREHGETTFERVHVEGTRNVLDAAKSAGVKRFIYMSALGAKEDGVSEYQTTKWQAEELTKASGLHWIIARPSLIIGRNGDFVKTLVDLATRYPVIPVIGSGEYKLQPVYAPDLIKAFIKMLDHSKYWKNTYEFGGPEQLTFNRIMSDVRRILKTKKPIVHIPMPIMKPLVGIMNSILSNPPITHDQLAMLMEDNVTNHNALTEVFGMEATPFDQAFQQSL